VRRFLGRVILGIKDGGVVAEFNCPRLGGFAEHDEPWVVQRGDDDGDFSLGHRLSRSR